MPEYVYLTPKQIEDMYEDARALGRAEVNGGLLTSVALVGSGIVIGLAIAAAVWAVAELLR